jgi:hypothetical protein
MLVCSPSVAAAAAVAVVAVAVAAKGRGPWVRHLVKSSSTNAKGVDEATLTRRRGHQTSTHITIRREWVRCLSIPKRLNRR